MANLARFPLPLLLAASLGAGCVTTSTHEQALADLGRRHQEELAQAKAQDDADKARAADLEKKLAEETQREAELRKLLDHTDDKRIHTARFPSNWELSTERAVVVTRFLIGKGLKPQSLGAVGYGEFDPLVDNDTDEHRAQNRRIEIQLQPNLSELPPMGDAAAVK